MHSTITFEGGMLTKRVSCADYVDGEGESHFYLAEGKQLLIE